MKTEYEKMISGELYEPADAQLIELRLRARLLTEQFNALSITQKDEQKKVLKELFGTTGERIYMEPNVRVDYGCNIHVGEDFYANYDCVILDVAPVKIGKSCLFGPKVGIYTATHPIDSIERSSGLELGKPITIGDNCWIGGSSVINLGVTLGNNVVVASGSVVTKSFGDNVVIGGNPAKVIKVIDEVEK